MTDLILLPGFSFQDLYSVSGLKRVDEEFLKFLQEADPELTQALLHFRHLETPLTGKALSSFLLQLALPLEEFMLFFFSIQSAYSSLQQVLSQKSIIGQCRQQFIQKQVKNRYSLEECLGFDPQDLWLTLHQFGIEDEFSFAEKVLQASPETAQPLLTAAAHYAAWAIYTPQGQARHLNSVLFYLPARQDFMHLVSPARSDPPSWSLDSLTSAPNLEKSLREAQYCLYCHTQDKDSCSKGLKERSQQTFKENPLGNSLSGCPLNQKISEMNWLYADLKPLASLAVITLDNPFVAATGHRICNECRKACIFQQQEPVDIPLIETRILRDILELPWGFEIYSLLTRWNPLNLMAPYPAPSSGYQVLVVGQGPAGFTLAHHLLNAGHRVVAIDGLKIEPLCPSLLSSPLFSCLDLFQSLKDRTIEGFGGVAEYGITRRWDKNYLLLIRLLLERRSAYTLKESVRLGSQLTLETTFAQGFDHIALATGAGTPKILSLKNNFAPGVHFAADFLMALHLQGGYQSSSGFDLSGPVVVIGGGLTAMDAATEALSLLRHRGESNAEVTIVYRKSLQASPAYRLNHEEVQATLDQGVKILENTLPREILIDDQGQTWGLKVEEAGKMIILPAKSILIAVGTHGNRQTMDEEPAYFNLEHQTVKFWDPSEADLDHNFVVYKDPEHRSISIFGDLHPFYKGSVVKAMASATQGAKHIHRHLLNRPPSGQKIPIQDLDSYVVRLDSIAQDTFELVVHSPAAARAFQPGQFFRLQNYARDASCLSSKGPFSLLEPLALTGIRADPEKGLLFFIIFALGASSRLVGRFRPGEKISVMGPTGAPSSLLTGKQGLLMGEGIGVAAVLSQAQALKERNNKLIIILGHRSGAALFHRDLWEEMADQIIWCWDQMPFNFVPRAQDKSIQGDILEGLQFVITEKLLKDLTLEYVFIGASAERMQEFQVLQSTILKESLPLASPPLAQINAPMQCMMKGVCGRCIQRQWNPDKAQEEFIFVCRQQEQSIHKIDFNFLSHRLKHHQRREKQVLAQVSTLHIIN